MAEISVDVAIIGGGIAGVSLAGELAATHTVAVLEQERQLAYHASGRSAATFLETYGTATIRALTRASRPVLDHIGASQGVPVLTPRPLLWVTSAGTREHLDDLIAENPSLRRLDVAAAREYCPVLRPEWLAGAAIEDGAQDLDVAGLFDYYRRLAVTRGATLLPDARVRAGSFDGRVRLETTAGTVVAAKVVNAAGAWADDVAVRLGAKPRGITPMRRTVAVVSAPGVDRSWPLVADAAEGFYFRPEGDGLLVSPADRTPTEPCDAQPEIEDVALALDRANEATTLGLRHVRTSWAGLRTFAPDGDPVVGTDPDCPDLFWLAGQGGYGMQTAPAMALLACALVRGTPVPHGPGWDDLDAGRLGPARLTSSA